MQDSPSSSASISKKIPRFFIVLVQKQIPSNARATVAASVELLKALFVFSLSDDQVLTCSCTVDQTMASQEAESTITARAPKKKQTLRMVTWFVCKTAPLACFFFLKH